VTISGLDLTPAQHEVLSSALITWKYGLLPIPNDTYDFD